MKLTALKENLLAFSIAIILAIFAVFLANNTDLLKADIIGAGQGSSDVEGDVAYEFKDGNFNILANSNYEAVSSIGFDIIYDETSLILGTDSIDSDFEYSYSKSGEGRVKVIVTNVSYLNKGDEILFIETNNEEAKLNVTDLIITFTDGTAENLSISRK